MRCEVGSEVENIVGVLSHPGADPEALTILAEMALIEGAGSSGRTARLLIMYLRSTAFPVPGAGGME
eukprot:13123261-Heterocapsa_arctica.AAC.1